MSKVEIIVLNEEDAKTAEAYGADRLELVSAMTEGGLTPSYGIIKTVVQSVKIPVMVMVRPHSFSFVYRNDEWVAIREDIKIMKELGAAGIVFGAINNQQKVDFDMLSMVLEEAKGLSVTFHRAIDETNSLEAYQSLCHSSYKVDRILTSGGKPAAHEGLDILKRMIEESQKSANSPTIMPGSGLSANNIEYIHDQLHAAEYHFGSAVRIDGDFSNRINGVEIEKVRKKLVNRY
ncbi:copper homeostasis protein [Neobacillus bataviensis LMG 21833]|uniref:PF03932 family protein CutC n=1 Tax=Neobacillus bataviensis LMG 21833 TaxID=1117379 RepID=K6DNL8_9BACI|nr:copper homeostasis protein CutC [Neobacillus bataviensis]EKN69768.1 copper homeostasis protein [Neobacillus bataviensis LMG 21833]